jgi:hypothetical protein
MSTDTSRRNPAVRQSAIARGKALAAAQSTPALILSLLALAPRIEAARAKAEATGAIADYDTCAALNTAHAWTVGALEDRYPQAVEALEAAFEAAGEDGEVDYDAVLIAAIPAADRI